MKQIKQTFFGRWESEFKLEKLLFVMSATNARVIIFSNETVFRDTTTGNRLNYHTILHALDWKTDQLNIFEMAGKQLLLFLIKLHAGGLKKNLRDLENTLHRSFFVNFGKFLRTSNLKIICEILLQKCQLSGKFTSLWKILEKENI